MADERARPDVNRAKAGVVSGVTNDASLEIIQLRVDPTTKRLLVDSVGDVTQYAEDAVHVSGDIGTMALAVRQDTQADFGADGDYVPLSIDADGALRVSGGGGGIQYTEGDTDATITGTAILMEGASSTLLPVQGTVADGLLVNLGANNDISGTVTANLSATDNTVLDNIDTSLNAIETDAAAIEVLLGTIDADTGGILTAVQLIDNAISGAGFNITQFNGAAVPIGAGLEATALRVTVATDSTGVLSIDDNGGVITVDGTITANLSATDNAVLDAIEVDTTTIAGAVSGSEMQVDVVAALPAGTNLIGDIGLSGARTSGGSTPYKNIDVDESEDQVKATAGQIYLIHAINTTAAPLYLKIYNATAATVVVGTTVPDLTFPVPGNADSDGAGFTLSIPNGVAFGTAITIAGTTGVADADAGAPAANALVVNLGYA